MEKHFYNEYQAECYASAMEDISQGIAVQVSTRVWYIDNKEVEILTKIEYLDEDGKLHREDGPALIAWITNTEPCGKLHGVKYCQNGLIHRDPAHGPAWAFNYVALFGRGKIRAGEPYTEEKYYWEGKRVTSDFRPPCREYSLGRIFI